MEPTEPTAKAKKKRVRKRRPKPDRVPAFAVGQVVISKRPIRVPKPNGGDLVLLRGCLWTIMQVETDRWRAPWYWIGCLPATKAGVTEFQYQVRRKEPSLREIPPDNTQVPDNVRADRDPVPAAGSAADAPDLAGGPGCP